MKKIALIIIMFAMTSLQLFAERSHRPLYVLNGKITSKKELSTLDPMWIDKINVLKSVEDVAKYGKQGDNGVIEVFTNYDVYPIFSSKVEGAFGRYIESKIDWSKASGKLDCKIRVSKNGKTSLKKIESTDRVLTKQVKTVIKALPRWESVAQRNGEIVTAIGNFSVLKPTPKGNAKSRNFLIR